MIMFCPTCQKAVDVIPKIFGVKLCPYCNKILASDYTDKG